MKRRTTFTALGAIAIAATLGGVAAAADTPGPLADQTDMMKTADTSHMTDIGAMVGMMGPDHTADMNRTMGPDHTADMNGTNGPMGTGMRGRGDATPGA